LPFPFHSAADILQIELLSKVLDGCSLPVLENERLQTHAVKKKKSETRDARMHQLVFACWQAPIGAAVGSGLRQWAAGRARRALVALLAVLRTTLALSVRF
jgi:hypothetical protein